jgi:S-adenosyl-L-methionine hydrolase (adenosine-forming)
MIQPNGLITLLTDFGTEDVYVSIMKGVMLQIGPALTTVDLTHQIPPQNIALGAFQLRNAYPHFPLGTVHLAVVDPGVGSARGAIALATTAGFFVGPNNGIFSGVLVDTLQGDGKLKSHAVTLDNPDYWYVSSPSHTFHGRDIFAAIAAHLGSGISLFELGTPIALDRLITLDLPQFQSSETGLKGCIQAIDGFGNGISSIPARVLPGKAWLVSAAGQTFPSHSTYSDTAPGSPLSLIGSHGWVELAVNGGNARQQYGLSLGDPIDLTWD